LLIDPFSGAEGLLFAGVLLAEVMLSAIIYSPKQTQKLPLTDEARDSLENAKEAKR
jgi:hypothetical protein